MTHPDDHLQRLAFALEKYPERVEIYPMQDLVMESARKNEKRPAFLKLAVPDEVVKAIRGASARNPYHLLMVQIPKDVVERSQSSIVLPGEL